MSDLPRLPRRCRDRQRLAAAILACVAASACSHTSTPHAADTAQFNDQHQAVVRCLDHQTRPPGPDYTGGQHANTSKILVMAHYYVTNGSKPYCDGAQPSTVDRDWARLYVRLGGQPGQVNRILSPG